MPFPDCGIFGRRVSFERASFDCRALRIRIVEYIADDYEFQDLSISSPNISFENISFNGTFDYFQGEKYEDFAPKVNFKRVNFAAMSSVAIREANLEGALFQLAVLENVFFINNRWPRRKGKLRRQGRRQCYDEIESKRKVEAKIEDGSIDKSAKRELRRAMYDRLIHVYVGLKRNYEAHGDFVGAGDWFYGEMACRHRAARKKKSFGAWYRGWFRCTSWAYKLISDYGESYVRPFLWLVLAYVGFSVLYLFNGFPIGASGHELNYDLFNGGVYKWEDVLRALAFGFQAMTLRLNKNVVFMEWGAWPIFVFHIIVTATLVPLFLLALRRRFRR
jgi:hypothetical protein